MVKFPVQGMISRKIQAVSLFSGCGGSDLALQNDGYEIVWANDAWDRACEVYRLNLNNPRIECGDIADFATFPQAELLVGCYPCQGYTQGGRRDWNAPINFLYREFDRALRIIRPRAFIVENVNGMTYGDNIDLLNNQLHRFRLAGYRVKSTVLNAKDFGVGQNRRRIFLVGIRSDIDFQYEFPAPTHGPNLAKAYVTQRDLLQKMPEWPAGEFNEEPFHWYYLSRRRRYDWHEPSPCIVGHWRHVPLHPMSPPLKRIHTDKWVFAHDGRARRLAYKECAVLQGFPASFDWPMDSLRDTFQMIGNAVPPPLFSAVLGGLRGLWEFV
jgi:DNA (cytosine-5)-methyltransferase 1